MAAPLRLCEKWAFLFRRRFSPRRKGAKVAKEKRPLLWRHLILKSLRLKTPSLKTIFRSDPFQHSFPKIQQAPQMSEKHLAVIRKTC
jgi:hypothetical protein